MSASEEKCDTEKIVPRADQADLRFGCARLQDESGAPGVRPRRRRPRLRPKRRRDRHRNAGDDARPEGLGCPPSGVRVSQHGKGGWAQPADGCVFAENSHVLLAVRLQPHGHPAPGSDGIRCAELACFFSQSHKTQAGREPSKSSREHRKRLLLSSFSIFSSPASLLSTT